MRLSMRRNPNSMGYGFIYPGGSGVYRNTEYLINDIPVSIEEYNRALNQVRSKIEEGERIPLTQANMVTISDPAVMDNFIAGLGPREDKVEADYQRLQGNLETFNAKANANAISGNFSIREVVNTNPAHKIIDRESVITAVNICNSQSVYISPLIMSMACGMSWLQAFQMLSFLYEECENSGLYSDGSVMQFFEELCNRATAEITNAVRKERRKLE